MNLEKNMEAISRRALIAVVGKADLPLASGVSTHPAQKACNAEASLQGNPHTTKLQGSATQSCKNCLPQKDFQAGHNPSASCELWSLKTRGRAEGRISLYSSRWNLVPCVG